MGKDQDLLDAARNGNQSVVEKILSQKAKRSGPLASLRRGPGANVQDNSGYTPLHHACLNGHKDIVTLLLLYDASPNVVDHKGSSALHLAAWTGNTDIVKLVLAHSNITPTVNLANHDKETPLHCAAQHGHVDVVALLLQYDADPSIRNCREESPLDLAAQYGRLETVEVLVKARPDLLLALSTHRHSPLHLASRNGHKHVIRVLLDNGFDINTRTDSGSALHDAATFGKIDVVRLLLENGIDLNARDSHHRTALDILDELKTHMSQEIASLIRGERVRALTSPIQGHIPDRSVSNCDLQNANSRCYENVTLVPGQRVSSAHVDIPDRKDVYQVPPAPKSLESSIDDMELSASASAPSSMYQTPPPPRELDTMSIGSSYYDTPTTPRGSGTARLSLNDAETANVLLYQVPPPPREAFKRMSDPVERGSTGDRTLMAPLRNSADSDHLQRHMSAIPNYLPMVPVHTPYKYLLPPQKPPRKTVSPHSPTKPSADPSPGAYEYLCLATSGTSSSSSISGLSPPLFRFGIPGAPSDYVDMKMRNSFIDHESVIVVDGNGGKRKGPAYENVTLRSFAISKPNKPTSLELQTPEIINYDQLPTPDFPPPSPGTAESGIHLKIRPLSQEYKRRSKDMETLTEDEDFELMADNQGARLTPVKKENKSVCTEAGNPSQSRRDKMSTEDSSCTDSDHSPVRIRVGCTTTCEKRAETVSSLSILSPFDENAEWAKIADIMASFGGINIASNRELNGPDSAQMFFQTAVGEWLSRIGLAVYETIFLANGFDDLEFMGPDVLDVSDLVAMGVIIPDHRQRILESSKSLPMTEQVRANTKLTVSQWLSSIHLDEYIDTFVRHGYSEMERVLKMWEVELVTVLEVNIQGHKKRILASLGERPPMPQQRIDNSKKPNADTCHTKLEGNQPGQVDTTSGGTLKRRNGNRKSAAPPPPPKRSSSLSPCDPNGNKDSQSAEALRLRNPSQLFTGIPTSLTTTWRHKTEVFVKQGCIYTVQYLGTSPVQELNMENIESTKSSVQRLKKSTGELAKVPTINMLITYQGVQLMDIDTKTVVCEHDIRNIHCSWQDADDLNHFAYITKDHVTQNHYCHVFGVPSMDVAFEVLLTLGQAFEVAYQIAIQERKTPCVNNS